MHITTVTMKDETVYKGCIWMFKPEEGYFTLSGNNLPDQFSFKDVASMVTEGERISRGVVGDCDELERARKLGWKE